MGNTRNPRTANTRAPKKKSTYQPLQPLHYEEPRYQHAAEKKKDRSCSLFALYCLTILLYVIGITLGVLVACGSISSGIDGLYLAKLTTNNTQDTTQNISLRFGYFGGCVSFSNTTQSLNSTSNATTSPNLQTQCVHNMRGSDVDALTEELGKNLINTSLTTTLLPEAKRLQTDVFFWEPLIIHIFLFITSGAMLFTAAVSASEKRRYKAMLVFAAGLGAIAQGLALVVAIGSLQALNAVLGEDGSRIGLEVGGGYTISRGRSLDCTQAILAATTALFYLSMGVLFVMRENDAKVNIFNKNYIFSR